MGAVGGPGLTPPGDGVVAQAQGAILSSFLVSGNISSRYRGSKAKETDDIHSVNFVAWRKVIEAVGGWNEQFWPGEDSLICLAIKKAGYKQLLAPDVVVYHHRRSTWKGYFYQIRNYGIHRGYFAKRFPETSLRLGYFFPSLAHFGAHSRTRSFSHLPSLSDSSRCRDSILRILLVVVSSKNSKNITRVFLGIPLTHLAYGLGFVQGLFTRKLSR